jgi:micrococcal nuclease
MPADGNYDCADFETRAQAKAVLERDPSDPHYLDFRPRPKMRSLC